MNQGARVHPALLLRIATLRGNGALKASTLPYLYGMDLMDPRIYMGSPKPISKGQGERHTVTVVA
jgi:hypothetical protein